MASWDVFLFSLAVLVGVLLILTRLSTQVLQDAVESTAGEATTPADDLDHQPQPAVTAEQSDGAQPGDHPPETGEPSLKLSTRALWANVVITQGLFGLLLAAIAWYTGVPAAAFGVAADQLSAAAVSTGVAVGVAFYALSELATRVATRFGAEPPTALREALAAETPAGWVVLLAVVLPAIAVFEELLFRGAMIGALSVGVDAPVWLLIVVSSAAFGLGHSAQGRVGIVVTGLLGVGLAGVFVWSESLVVVIVAHYVINALEFVVHEHGSQEW